WSTVAPAEAGIFTECYGCLQYPAAKLFGQIVARTPGDRKHRFGRILARRAWPAAPIDDEQVLEIVRLAKTIQDARPRILSHARSPHLMTDRAGRAEGIVRGKHLRSGSVH